MTDLPRHVIGIIVDDFQVSKWQADALAELRDAADFIVLNCTNTRSRRQPLKHALYYILNLISLRSPPTRSAALPEGLRIKQVLDFEAEPDGNWQRFPRHVIDSIVKAKPACLIKFGMTLLRVPDRISCPILSYHHGDPRRFRGRPAGFYELLSGEPILGQVVQRLSNQLDAGAVVAFAQTRAITHSYRATMLRAYRCSPLLLPEAIRNALNGKTLPLEPAGKNYRLPSNALVMRFCARIAAAKLKHLARGLFRERRWKSATAPGSDPAFETLVGSFPSRDRWSEIKCPPGYHFIADPFPHPFGGLLVEALRASDQQGEIVHLGSDRRTVCSGAGHFSYPGTISVDGSFYLLPEVAEWSDPRLYQLSGHGAEETGVLKVKGSPHLIDPTLFRDALGRFYLFGNRLDEGSDVLRLWTSEGLFKWFDEHPSSPLRISPRGSRMGGALVERHGRLFRLGQDYSRTYGDGIIVFEVTELTPDSFSEAEVGGIKFEDVKGPHTLNFTSGTIIFDFYENRLAPLAGWRRFRALVAKARARAAHIR